MLKTKAVFQRKTPDFEPGECVIEKVVELSGRQYDRFSRNMLYDYDFIEENIDLMHRDSDGVNHCLLVTGEGRNDGILIESEGATYARYSAFMPNAADFLAVQNMSPALKSLNKMLEEIAGYIIGNADATEQPNQYKTSLDAIKDQYSINFNYDEVLLETVCDMIAEKAGIVDVSYDNDFIYYSVEPKMLMESGEADYSNQNYEKLF